MPFAKGEVSAAHGMVRKIGVIGPGIVGMPMAPLLARAATRAEIEGDTRVVVVQRRSENIGWTVDAINAGRSPLGGLEPDPERLIADAVSAGRLTATEDYGELRDADLVLVCVRTDKDGPVPDYGPLHGSLTLLGREPLPQARRSPPACRRRVDAGPLDHDDDRPRTLRPVASSSASRRPTSSSAG